MADSIRLNIDTSKFAEGLREKLDTFANADTLLRPIALDLVALMTERIHDRGMGSDGELIKSEGYSEGYLQFRQEKHNRTADKKVIISLTRQLENDWSVVAVKNGYGIGFKNSFNYQKAGWVSEMFAKNGNNDRIFSLSASEREYATNRFNELLSEQLGT